MTKIYSAITHETSSAELGPLVNDVAPFSAIGLAELNFVHHHLSPFRDGQIDEPLSSLDNRLLWKYRSGEHSSPQSKIIGSIVLSALSDCRS